MTFTHTTNISDISLVTNVLQPHEPVRRVGEVAAEVRTGSTNEIQQHKEILEKREHEEREVRGLVSSQKTHAVARF